MGGENSVVQMLGSLYDAIENDYGAIATRLYRAFKPKPGKFDVNVYFYNYINLMSCFALAKLHQTCEVTEFYQKQCEKFKNYIKNKEI